MSRKNPAPETGHGKALCDFYNGKKVVIHVPIGDKTLEVHLTVKQALRLADDIYRQLGVVL